MHPLLLAAASGSLWTFNTGILMLVCNLLAVVIGRYTIKYPGQGPALPFGVPDFMKDFGVPEMLATGALGHILGAGMILGLRTSGAL
ncbi:MAG: photosystem I reaction center subunit PsaK [Acaryochloris sp. RU_4_1]|nr:photosystem I reaction center subunit PsaK [Acaryochloris sp. SU_5_25]NJM68023.1 photosystem I reaction center subunit PsaK [Acaryochloris sp. RU_4_1]NJN39072.1 photosystem I reaction center subunit PsaK [Acaryochloridaceae cyanobacterium CSU_3_4]NJR56734.1 photosystem I reaction center subunit PsaK [Acaryochloris sp. CRU_2_0]